MATLDLDPEHVGLVDPQTGEPITTGDDGAGGKALNVRVVSGGGGGGPSTNVNIDQYGGVATTLGQKAMTASVPVAIANNQSNLPVVGAAANGAAVAGNPVLIAGSNGISAQTLVMDGGKPLIVGAAAEGTAAQSNPLRTGGWDGANIRTLRTTTDGTQEITAVDSAATATLNALNAAVSIAVRGLGSVALELSAGTLIGTITAEVSYDGGTTWRQGVFLDRTNERRLRSITFVSANGLVCAVLPVNGGVSHVRVRVSAFTSGSAVALLRAVFAAIPPVLDDIPRRATYSAAVLGLLSAATATDIFTIAGSATRRVRVMRIEVSSLRTTAGISDVQLVRRSTANTGGTSAARVASPHGSNDPAATATVLSYTANPTTLGTLVAAIRASKIFAPAATSIAQPSIVVWTFGEERGAKNVELIGTSELLAVNLNGATVTGGNWNLSIEWTEE